MPNSQEVFCASELMTGVVSPIKIYLDYQTQQLPRPAYDELVPCRDSAYIYIYMYI